MTEEKIEQLKHELGKFGVVEKCQEGFGQLFIRITECFEAKAVDTAACLNLVILHVKDEYQDLVSLQVRKGYFLLMMKQIPIEKLGTKVLHSRPYIKTEKDGQKSIRPIRE